MKEQRRRTTADGSANTCAFVVRRWPKKTLTTKAQRHKGKTHREAREVREEREKRFSPQRRRGAEEVIRGKDARAKRQGHGGKRAVVCGLSVLDSAHP
jgi:hypothetical protein